ncbi:hypothetical protein D9758_013672 [Tetrapyrgos nigripes]|uniref:Transglycosylase SLT domain-containing protein n=1 Tax=Tetrapyrgos nigripes TaxID=182062 RepID=A0A8H5FNJ7_9AGAR|nr:hypothetical protein D9758_013672 [Tetrapyrgos nigripes]
MKFDTFILAALASAVLVEASNPLIARHGRLAQRSRLPESSLRKRSTKCKNRSIPSSSSGESTSANTSDNNNNQGNAQITTNVNIASLPAGGGTWDITTTSGPNGDIDYLNQGINDGVVDLTQALSDPNSPFHACAPYVDMFYNYGRANGIPPIILASFAMQESTCNPETVGGGGEQGLMQLTQEKCGNAPGGNCRDPDYNIRTGAEFFARTLNDKGGNVVLAIGSYNGWFQGMTYTQATAAAFSSCCRCQNNLDYVFQFLNGWCQNVNAYQMKLGKYFNLAVCF